MDVIIVVHTEFGYIHNYEVVYDKNATNGVNKGVFNLIKLADKYGAKITFAVMPEVVKSFPRDIEHEIGLHIHAGWEESRRNNLTYHVGDRYLREHCDQSLTSTLLREYPYHEQLEMIQVGSEYLEDSFGEKPTTFVAGRWAIDNRTIRALVNSRMERDCSAPAHSPPCHHDWSKLPRICMPYHPSENDYQINGDLPLLIVPISQMLFAGNVNPEVAPKVGLSWLKACFYEYYMQSMPLFQICLHSPSMTDPYFLTVMDEFLKYISKYSNINYVYSREVYEYPYVAPSTMISPYILGLNKKILKNTFESIKLKFQKKLL
ncbi:hypothetical protein ACKUB1_15840 [Methanospirillum stamsii]|uniref:PTS alpha-glucoside transporter subunit IIBC n=1 Tax=Methanospirillum stamsii TaxID=1277351 RepID=A0A2V2N232_9EURY|nr:PTS alpha-glucoside transporter subunit IIBC [Methanospirillum stamsii]PWR71776.1 PTS alpha-glucoside transporter subunit IIBC [Methanospirillum stamsii]